MVFASSACGAEHLEPLEFDRGNAFIIPIARTFSTQLDSLRITIFQLSPELAVAAGYDYDVLAKLRPTAGVLQAQRRYFPWTMTVADVNADAQTDLRITIVGDPFSGSTTFDFAFAHDPWGAVGAMGTPRPPPAFEVLVEGFLGQTLLASSGLVLIPPDVLFAAPRSARWPRTDTIALVCLPEHLGAACNP